MKYKFIKRENSTSLAVLFTGWGFTPDYYEDADISCDFVVVYDYVNINLDTSIFNGYTSIYLFAWSFGVFEAYRFFADKNSGYPIVFSMAVNGTIFPVNDEKGIPEAIFNGTHDNLCERTLNKFYLRMCGSSVIYKDFIKKCPKKNITGLKEELRFVYNHSLNEEIEPLNDFIWDIAVVSKNDNIFPFENQLKGWKNNCNKIIVSEGPHLYNDLIRLINSRIIDKKLIKKRFSKILDSYSKEAIPQNLVSKELFRKWASIDIQSNKSILEIGCGTGFLTKLYAGLIKPSQLVLNDLCKMNFTLDNVDYSFVEGDAEEYVANTNCRFDYILSASAIQWFENIPALFQNFKRILNKGGYLILSTFGNRNFEEIESLTHNSLKYLSIQNLKEYLDNDFDVFYLDEKIIKMDFETPMEVLKHLRLTGVNSLRPTNHWTKSNLNSFIDNYPKNNDGLYSLTYNPIYIIARLR